MDAVTLRNYCLAKPGADEDTPFGPDTLCFKVVGKLFALLSLDEAPLRMNLKCEPERAQQLRAQYAAVLPGYHMNKKHWNTLVLDGSLPSRLVLELVDHSWDRVALGLPKQTQALLRDSQPGKRI